MAMLCFQKEYLVTFFYGLTLAYCLSFGDHHVIYEGDDEVGEGEPFQITCMMRDRDLPGWTINSSVIIAENNDLGYSLHDETGGTFRLKRVLEVQSAQLFHEGEYRCNKYSRDYHHLTVIPDISGGEEDEDDEDKTVKGDVKVSKPSNEYVLEVGKNIEFYCESARGHRTSVTWYKNGRRILENFEENIELVDHTLFIKNAQQDDAGEYMCTVDFTVHSNNDIGRIFRLNAPAKIVDFSQKASVVRGKSLKLRCKTQGYPPPKITWYIGNLNASELRKKDFRISIYAVDGGLPNSALEITDISTSDRGLYTCRAENSVDSGLTVKHDEESVFVHVRENMIETNEDEPGLGKILIPGEALVLQCNISECSLCKVVWFKDGEQLNPTSGHLNIYEKNNSVVIEHASYNDSGNYVCAIDRNQTIHGKHKMDGNQLNASIVVQSKIKLEKFGQSAVVVQGSPLELHCAVNGTPAPYIKWFIGGEEIHGDDRIKLLELDGLKNAKLLIEEADFDDRNHYTCEAFNQVDSVNTTIFIRIKDKLAALWPFLGICAEVAILCTIIFVYERRKSMTQCDEPETDLPADNKHRDKKAKGQDVRQRKQN